MKKWVICVISMLVLTGLFCGVVDASFSVGNLSHSIQTSYGPGTNITGWINISFVNQSGGSLLKDSSGNSIILLKLLRNQTEYDYSCFPSGCGNSYLESNSETTKTFNLVTGEEKLVGIKISGEVTGISFKGLKLESDADLNCYNQIKLDFLDDGTYEKGNNNSNEDSCSSLRDYGCYDSGKSTSERNIGQIPYCQRIELTESPGFRLGGWIKKSGTDSTIKMFLKNIDRETIEGTTCTLPTASESGSEIYCSVNFLITEAKEYYVCINSNVDTNYKILGYDNLDKCGFYGDGFEEERAAYSIFAEGKKFGAVGNISITNYLPNENTLSGLIEDYLISNYSDEDYSCSGDCIADCSSGCIVPIKIKSGKNQRVILKNLDVEISTATGKVSSTNFYDLSKDYPKINSGFGKLKIDNGGFSAPISYGNSTFNLYLGESKIFSEKISIERVPTIISIKPSVTVSAFPTDFSVKINSSSNITKYYWKFGDGQDTFTSTNKVTHTYNSTGTYNLEIEVTDNKERSSIKTFQILVGDPKALIGSMLNEKTGNLTKIKSQLSKFSSFYQNQLNLALKTEELNNDLKDLERRYKASFSEGEYNKILGELIEVEVPSYLEISTKGNNLLFFPSENAIKFDVLEEIEKGSYDPGKESEYKDAILSWQQENLEVSISFEEISGTYGLEQKKIGTFYELDIKRIIDTTYNPYLIIKEINGLEFEENYLESEKSGYKYIPISSDKKVGFFTTESLEFSELPMFISPGTDRLTLSEVNVGLEEDKPINFALLSMVLVLVFLIGIVTYIILQEWYKKKYENYLFRDQTNLYNLINYIDNTKRKGFSDRDIEKRLLETGWNSEQVNYATKKYAGKRTGMIEIPIGKILNKFTGKKDISAQQNAPMQTPPRAVVPFPIRPKIPSVIVNQNNLKGREMFFKK